MVRAQYGRWPRTQPPPRLCGSDVTIRLLRHAFHDGEHSIASCVAVSCLRAPRRRTPHWLRCDQWSGSESRCRRHPPKESPRARKFPLTRSGSAGERHTVDRAQQSEVRAIRAHMHRRLGGCARAPDQACTRLAPASEFVAAMSHGKVRHTSYDQVAGCGRPHEGNGPFLPPIARLANLRRQCACGEFRPERPSMDSLQEVPRCGASHGHCITASGRVLSSPRVARVECFSASNRKQSQDPKE